MVKRNGYEKLKKFEQEWIEIFVGRLYNLGLLFKKMAYILQIFKT